MNAGSIGRENTLPKASGLVPSKWGGLHFPVPSMEESPPHAAKRSALAPGPGKSLEFYNAFLGKWVIGG
ncbi:MAG: hypothetical protein ABH969_09780 [Pseudomonadota bacterium]